MTNKQLSPAAQAVKDAAQDAYWLWDSMCPADAETIAAAALRAAAGCVPKENWGGENYATGFRDGIAFGCQFLHELANELEGKK
jgi:hypothetical protein